MKQTFDCYIKTVSPVHIGCDEVYEPTGFVIDKNAKQLIAFDPFEFFQSLEDQEIDKFSKICRKGTIESIIEIYKFFENKQAQGKHVDVCEGFLENYKKTLQLANEKNRGKIGNELNSFTIHRTAFNTIDQRPYIPGSSIKGSLRTAYLNYLAGIKKVRTQKGRDAAGKLEESLLSGSFASDPFRLVKVSDFMPVGDVKTRIIYAVNKKKKPSKYESSGPPQIIEVIQTGAAFKGKITVEKAHDSIPSIKKEDQIRFSILLNSAEQFYNTEKTKENNIFKKLGIPENEIFKEENSYPIRIGKHCGAESITIEGYRSITIRRGGKEKPLTNQNKTTTIWLAADNRKPKNTNRLAPFGWAELAEINNDLKEEFSRHEAEWKKTEKLKKEELQNQQIKKQKEEEARQKLAIERQKKEDEEKKLKEELEKMSPEQRAVAELKSPSIIENRAVEIYKNIENYQQDYQKTVAKGLKNYWIAKNKWEKKKCTKKQFLKVQTIKEILGEI